LISKQLKAFHAKLRQKAVAVFGQAAINQWPIPIDDMTLNQLATYFETEAKTDNMWETVEHDWMACNMSDMATALQEFVQTFYPTTYAQVGSALAPISPSSTWACRTQRFTRNRSLTPASKPPYSPIGGSSTKEGNAPNKEKRGRPMVDAPL
jgi:hypothetical protein